MKQFLIVMMLLIAATSFSGISSDANAGTSTSHQFCHYYKQKAMWTGDEYWWERWRHCLKDWGS